jgi:hypothetical protein
MSPRGKEGKEIEKEKKKRRKRRTHHLIIWDSCTSVDFSEMA